MCSAEIGNQPWAGKYVDLIQQHLNAKETGFSIDADNQSFPPSISGIQNGIIAYKISLWEWKSNAIKAELSASSKVITSSSNKLNVKLNFEVTYQPKTGYEVFYHSAAASGASPQSTPVAYGRPMPTLTASELGFSNGSAKFLGWCVSSRGFEQKEHRKLSGLSIGSAHAF